MKTFFILISIFLLFPHYSFALNVETKISEEINLDKFIDTMPTEMGNLIDDFDFFSGQGLEEIADTIKDAVIESLKEQAAIVWKPAMQTLLVVIICGIISSIVPGKTYDFPIMVVGSVSIIHLCLGDIHSFFVNCVDVIQKIYDFSTVLLPCLAGASVFAGATVSAGMKYTAAALFMNILLNFCNTMLVPLVSLYLATMIGSYVFEQPILEAVSKLVRWGCLTALTGAVIVFTTYLTVAGLISGTNEVLTARIAKTTLSGGLPIVGKIISDTASTLVAGASMLRNTVGILGMASTVFIFIVPFISVGLRYLLFKAVSEFSDLYPDKRFSGLIKGISEAYGILFAMIGSGIIMIFMTILSFMQLAVQ